MNASPDMVHVMFLNFMFTVCNEAAAPGPWDMKRSGEFVNDQVSYT
jgi:hypothetical protein